MKIKIFPLIFFIIFFLSFGFSVYNFILSFEKITVIEKTEVQKINITPVMTDSVSIDPFSFPLDADYLSNVSSYQGMREALSEEEAGVSTSGKWHNGYDIVCPEKTKVYAAKDGVVSMVYPSYYNGGRLYKGHPVYGGLVVIKHFDSTITLYGHLSYTEVLVGDIVEQGQEIGWSGGVKNKRGSGTSTGPHLHFSIYIDMQQFMDWSEEMNNRKRNHIDDREKKDENQN